MQAELIIQNLQFITTSRCCSIGKLYNNPEAETSNVLRFIKALQSIKKEDRIQCKVTVDVSFEEVLDMLEALQNGVEAYKQKYKVRTFPSNFNTYQLIESLNRLSASDIIKEVIGSSKSDKPINKATKKKKPIQKGRIEYNGDIKSQMVLDALKSAK